MKITILGSNGFVGSNIASRFERDGNTVFRLNRHNINLLDPAEVKQWLVEAKSDVIINCAATMNNTVSDITNNLGIFMNFYQNAHLFGRFINTGSGAELDRTLDLQNVTEQVLFDRLPKDPYGFAQNVKARLCFDRENFCSLRIFNCFGTGEAKTRIIPRYLHNENFSINDDRYFDMFGIDDLYTVIKHYAVVHHIPDYMKDVNCVYTDKYKISEILNMFKEMHDITKPITIESKSDLNYTGSGAKLASLGLELKGLAYSLNEY